MLTYLWFNLLVKGKKKLRELRKRERVFSLHLEARATSVALRQHFLPAVSLQAWIAWASYRRASYIILVDWKGILVYNK
jgi:hypothetical protein